MKSRILLKNKRGDVPTMILVIGVFAVCALAIGSFFYSGISLNKSFEPIKKMEKINFEIEKAPVVNHHEEILKKKIVFDLNSKFVKEVVSFSVDYFGGG